jgi:hypothetical protein
MDPGLPGCRQHSADSTGTGAGIVGHGLCRPPSSLGGNGAFNNRHCSPGFPLGLVLLITLFCGIFRAVWQFVEAGFVKKIRPDSNFLTFLILGKCLEVGGGIVIYGSAIASYAMRSTGSGLLFLGLLASIAGFVILYVGIFKMREAMEEYYNTVEPINLRLSPVMTFFFPTFYFQHHFSRIARWKNTGYLEPQQ